MKNNGALLVLAAAILWGTTGTAQALAPDSAGPAAIGTARLAVGGVALLAFALSRRAFARSGRWSVWSVLIAAACMAAYQLFFFAGVARTGVAVGTIVGIGSAPILAGAIGFLVRGERPGSRWAVATLLAVLGCSLLIAAGRSIHVDPSGLLLATGAGAAYASFTVASKDLLEHNPPEAVMAAIFCVGALFLAPLFFTADFTWLAQGTGLAVTLHLGLVTVALAYSLFARGLSLVSVATTATLTLAEPLTAGTLGVLLLGERLTLMAGLGILLIFTGLALVTVRQQTASFPT
jgi:DME family drug/metabolite transporter